MEPIYLIVVGVLVPLMRLLFRWTFIGLEKLPRMGPAIVAPNHISNLDPLCVGYMVVRAGRRPRFLGKASLWKKWYLRIILDGVGQIPVERGTGRHEPLDAALDALRRGEVVVVYPEATITTNPDLTPMQGKTGVARLALATGVPVYPVAQWGPQWYIAKYHKSSYRPWRRFVFKVGEPLTFPDLEGKQDDHDVRREVTDRVMAEVDRLVREVQKIHPDGAATPELKERA
jgi:1-acyl-sn-glycerol-3-phosphate acyltransferase